jgi:drug/metabolite transporter superfamily protein YnfA
MGALAVQRPLSLFIVPGVSAIGGGWRMWRWLRGDKPGWRGPWC